MNLAGSQISVCPLEKSWHGLNSADQFHLKGADEANFTEAPCESLGCFNLEKDSCIERRA